MRVSLLGPLAITDGDGHAVNIKGAKVLSVLVALLFQQRVSDDALTSYLWGEDPPTTAQSQVYTYISRLRAVLGDAFPIMRQGSSYCIDRSGVWLDADAFTSLARQGHHERANGDLEAAEQTLTEAMSLWRGCALAEVTPELRDLVLPPLEHVRILAAEDLGAVVLGLGRPQEHLPMLERLVRENPTHEPLNVQLMQALHRSGRRGEALQAFHRLGNSLREELGLDPSEHVQALHLALLRGEEDALTGSVGRADHDLLVDDFPAVVHLKRPSSRDGDGQRFATELLQPSSGFGSNVPDLGALCDRVAALRQAHPRRPACIMVTGMPGLGKATFAATIARAWPGEFQPRVQARLTDDSHREVPLHRVMADILAVIGETSIGTGHHEIERRYRAVMAERPAILVLEDAQTPKQVAPLLVMHPGSLTLVTGYRMTAPLEGSVRIHRRPLTPQQSRAFLARLLGGRRTDELTGPGMDRLIGACGGLPALLRAVATRLGDPSMSPKRLWSHLLDDELRGLEFERAGGVPVALAREQMATLTQRELSVVRAAVRMGCPVTVSALKDALGWRRSSTRVVLEELELLGVMSREPREIGDACWRLSWLLRGVGEDLFHDVLDQAVDF